MKTFRFLDFPVYIKAKNFYKKILINTDRLEPYSLKDQVRRASLSVVLNIAEGSDRESDKEFFRFIPLSLGSINEVVACLDVMYSTSLISRQNFNEMISECEEIAKQLGGFSKKLKIG